MEYLIFGFRANFHCKFECAILDSSQNSLKPLRPSKSRKRKAESSIEDRLENVKISKTNSTTESQENCQVASQGTLIYYTLNIPK